MRGPHVVNDVLVNDNPHNTLNNNSFTSAQNKNENSSYNYDQNISVKNV